MRVVAWLLALVLTAAGTDPVAGESTAMESVPGAPATDTGKQSIVYERSEIEVELEADNTRPGSRQAYGDRVDMIMGGGVDGKAKQATIPVLE